MADQPCRHRRLLHGWSSGRGSCRAIRLWRMGTGTSGAMVDPTRRHCRCPHRGMRCCNGYTLRTRPAAPHGWNVPFRSGNRWRLPNAACDNIWKAIVSSPRLTPFLVTADRQVVRLVWLCICVAVCAVVRCFPESATRSHPTSCAHRTAHKHWQQAGADDFPVVASIHVHLRTPRQRSFQDLLWCRQSSVLLHCGDWRCAD